MKTAVIYHSADFDGIFCREIARKFLPQDTEFIGWNFGDPVLPYPTDTKVYVFDLPCDRPFGLQPKDFDDATNITWIDHHKTAIESHPKDIPGYRIDGVAACRLVWQWFTEHFKPEKQEFIDRKVHEPLAVRLAGEYDIWDKRDPEAELFQHGLKSEEVEFDRLLTLRGPVGARYVQDLLNQGRTLQYAREQEYAQVIKEQGFDVQWEGLTFLACNSHELDIRSHLFAAGIRAHHQALLGFTWSGKHWRISMYHAPGHEQHDLSAIAVKCGGGGHRGACGFNWHSWSLPFPLSA